MINLEALLEVGLDGFVLDFLELEDLLGGEFFDL